MKNFLKSKAIDKIDFVILTHFHTDHINGIYDIEAKIDKIGYSIPKENSKEYRYQHHHVTHFGTSLPYLCPQT